MKSLKFLPHQNLSGRRSTHIIALSFAVALLTLQAMPFSASESQTLQKPSGAALLARKDPSAFVSLSKGPKAPILFEPNSDGRWYGVNVSGRHIISTAGILHLTSGETHRWYQLFTDVFFEPRRTLASGESFWLVPASIEAVELTSVMYRSGDLWDSGHWEQHIAKQLALEDASRSLERLRYFQERTSGEDPERVADELERPDLFTGVGARFFARRLKERLMVRSEDGEYVREDYASWLNDCIRDVLVFRRIHSLR